MARFFVSFVFVRWVFATVQDGKMPAIESSILDALLLEYKSSITSLDGKSAAAETTSAASLTKDYKKKMADLEKHRNKIDLINEENERLRKSIALYQVQVDKISDDVERMKGNERHLQKYLDKSNSENERLRESVMQHKAQIERMRKQAAHTSDLGDGDDKDVLESNDEKERSKMLTTHSFTALSDDYGYCNIIIHPDVPAINGRRLTSMGGSNVGVIMITLGALVLVASVGCCKFCCSCGANRLVFGFGIFGGFVVSITLIIGGILWLQGILQQIILQFATYAYLTILLGAFIVLLLYELKQTFVRMELVVMKALYSVHHKAKATYAQVADWTADLMDDGCINQSTCSDSEEQS